VEVEVEVVVVVIDTAGLTISHFWSVLYYCHYSTRKQPNWEKKKHKIQNLSPKLTLRSLTLYIYGAPILDVSRSHTTTQHSR